MDYLRVYYQVGYSDKGLGTASTISINDFLYLFFDYSNLNHSKVFYLFLYYNNFSVSLCRFVAFFRETLETLETLCTLFALSVRAFILVPFLLYLVLFTLTLLFALFTCGRHVFDLYY